MGLAYSISLRQVTCWNHECSSSWFWNSLNFIIFYWEKYKWKKSNSIFFSYSKVFPVNSQNVPWVLWLWEGPNSIFTVLWFCNCSSKGYTRKGLYACMTVYCLWQLSPHKFFAQWFCQEVTMWYKGIFYYPDTHWLYLHNAFMLKSKFKPNCCLVEKRDTNFE